MKKPSSSWIRNWIRHQNGTEYSNFKVNDSLENSRQTPLSKKQTSHWNITLLEATISQFVKPCKWEKEITHNVAYYSHIWQLYAHKW